MENQSLLSDAQTLQELLAVLAKRIRYYNRERRHSSLGNRAPETFIREDEDAETRLPEIRLPVGRSLSRRSSGRVPFPGQPSFLKPESFLDNQAE